MLGHGKHFLAAGHDFASGQEEAVVACVAEFDAEAVADFAEGVGPVYGCAAVDYACLRKLDRVA
jgi:hypothetical protein